MEKDDDDDVAYIDGDEDEDDEEEEDYVLDDCDDFKILKRRKVLQLKVTYYFNIKLEKKYIITIYRQAYEMFYYLP